ncbi:DUF4405 domain-containing protein [Lederbergia lenta]|uniref:Flavinylation-associated cytochrome domain-containing protein n=1 Tax=Lederbergia lenta TaxID=1467 RepID=A0A2X4WAH9_LEDLE|nr:DUF4405 domain-containing protein [Lederbergia lenta]MEC2324409.1 DUF4405 domain-containing protein [Lederbergia lenta]SQI60033.1 Uncharacterised protein [Lederbergia lenta]
MNRNIAIRLAVDLTMTILMLVAMAYRITGNTIHEVVGLFLFLLFIAHNTLNKRWYKAIAKGKYNIRRVLSITVNLLFVMSMVTIMISSLPISSDIFPFISVNNQMIWREIHVLTSYWAFLLMAVHIGMSWRTIISAVGKMSGITHTSRIRTITLRFIAVMIVVYGVQTSFEREMSYKLTIYNPFGWGDDDSTFRFLIDHLAIMGIYISGAHYVLKFVQRKKKASKK